MSKNVEIVVGLLMLITIIWFIARIAIKRLYRSTDPGDLVIKWIITVLAVMFWIYLGVKAGKADYGMAFIIPGVAAASGIILSILWAPHIAGILSSPFTKWYTGGDEEAEVKPLYSMATAYRKRGNYDQAVVEVHKQLDRFPNDYQGWMMLAEIQAEDLNDLDAAVATVNRLLSLPELHAKNAAYALGRIADWHLDQRQDRDAAREAFQRVIELFPNTVESQLAEQRLAHMASAHDLADQHDRRVIALKHSEERIGLLGRVVEMAPDVTPSEKARHFVDHLREFPADNEAREKLAVLYAEEFKRLDLATNELEELIARPNQLPKSVAHWLNMLADFQVRLTNDVEAARATLQRVIDTFPSSAAASNARTRLGQLRLELKQHSHQRTVKLGQYEQNIGIRNMNSSGKNE